jgi:hypothetical protein
VSRGSYTGVGVLNPTQGMFLEVLLCRIVTVHMPYNKYMPIPIQGVVSPDWESREFLRTENVHDGIALWRLGGII